MEAIKRLEEAAKACLSDLKSIDSKVSVTEGNLAFLDSKKTKLTAEIGDLEAKKAAIMDLVGTMEKDARLQIDSKLTEIKAKEGELNNLRADLKVKIFQAESSATEAEQAKDKYAAVYTEYLEKVKDLDDKKNAVMAALK